MSNLGEEHYLVSDAEDGMRLDRFLVSRIPNASRNVVRRLLAKGVVQVQGRRRAKGSPLKEGEEVVVSGRVPPAKDRWTPSPNPELKIPVIYSDDDLLVVNKPAGIPCHPLRQEERETVANGMVSSFPELTTAGEVGREAGLIHRLDTSTSGVLVFARRREAFGALVTQIRGESATKTYLALVEGDASGISKSIEYPLFTKGKRVEALLDPFDRRSGALSATTLVKPIKSFKGYTLVEARIHAGRRHQIRVHLASDGYPIAGDDLYGGAMDLIGRPFLHARRIELVSPTQGTTLEIEAALPLDLESLLEELSQEG